MRSTPDPALVIREMLEQDWNAVREIYLEGIATGDATFEAGAPDWITWDGNHLRACRFVASLGSKIVGWAAVSPVSQRRVYSGVAEVSVYVGLRVRGRGIGSKLLAALVNASESSGIWTLQAGIFPENTASVQLHRRAGFRIVGTRERLGCMNGQWRDVLLMERRSAVAGIQPFT